MSNVALKENFFNKYDEAFIRLAQTFSSQIPFYPGEKVLDIGCRNGKVTQILASMNPDVQFQAITTTKEFLSLIVGNGNKLGNIEFNHKPLTDLGFKNDFDKVVSFSCLTWITDKKPVLAQTYDALKPGGTAYLQLFVDHGQDWFDRCIFAIAQKPQWQKYFNDFKREVEHIKPGHFLKLAEDCGFTVQKGNLNKKEIPVLNEDYLKNWMMTWSSHLAYLPQNLADEFFSQAAQEYQQANPKDGYGRLYYRDYFFEAILTKPI